MPSSRVEAFILAGGLSTRMGADKRGLAWGKGTMLQHAFERAARVAARVRAVYAAGASRGQQEDSVLDEYVQAGPLGGIHAALRAAQSDLILVTPVDVPLVPVALLAYLIERSNLTDCPATIPCISGRVQPLIAVYRRELFGPIERALAEGRYKVLSAVQSLGNVDVFHVESVEQSGRELDGEGIPRHLWFSNMNRPHEYSSLTSFVQKCKP